MPLIATFVLTFIIVYFLQQRRGAIMLDRLHRATLYAMGMTFLVFTIAAFAGG